MRSHLCKSPAYLRITKHRKSFDPKVYRGQRSTKDGDDDISGSGIVIDDEHEGGSSCLNRDTEMANLRFGCSGGACGACGA